MEAAVGDFALVNRLDEALRFDFKIVGGGFVLPTAGGVD